MDAFGVGCYTKPVVHPSVRFWTSASGTHSILASAMADVSFMVQSLT